MPTTTPHHLRPLRPDRAEEIGSLLGGWCGDGALGRRLAGICAESRRVVQIYPEHALSNARGLSVALELSPKAVVRACCVYPDLLYQSPGTLVARIRAVAELLGVPLPRFVKKTIAKPSVWNCDAVSVGAKLIAVSSGLGIAETECRRWFAATPGLIGHGADWLVGNIDGIAGTFGLERNAVVVLLKRRPEALLCTEDRIQRFRDRARDLWQISDDSLGRLVVRCPALLLQTVDSLDRNLCRLSALLAIDRPVLMQAAFKFPPLLYLRPEGIVEKLHDAARAMKLPESAMAEALLAMPSLAGRNPRGVARSVRLAGKIARALKQPCDAATILVSVPSVPTYGANRLLLRLLVARLSLWDGKLSTLVVRVDDRRVRSMLEQHIERLRADSIEAVRLRSIIDRRMNKSK